MKSIGNIFLVWRKGKGTRRIPVGLIKKNSTNGVTFKYLVEGVEKAQEQGFTAYEGFPDLNVEYSKNVAQIFGQRIVRSDRSDVSDFYDFWKVDTKYKDDPYYMLAFTQGIVPTDNFEFLVDFNPVKGLSFITEIAGLSKSSIDASELVIGDVLNYQHEKSNEFDKYAVKVLKGKTDLGYIKLINSRVFCRAKSKIKIVVKHIEKNGFINRVFLDAVL